MREGAGDTLFNETGDASLNATAVNSPPWAVSSVDYNGSTQYHEAASPGITDYPVTMAIRCKPDAVATVFPFEMADEGTTTNYIGVSMLNTGAVRAQMQSGTGSFNAEGGSYSAGEDITIVARFTSATSRDVWLNGELVGTNTTSDAFPSGIDNITVGALKRTTVSLHFNGKIYWARLWDRDLTDEQIVSLHANPNIVYEPHRMFVPGAAGVGGGTIPIFYHHYAMLRAY